MNGSIVMIASYGGPYGGNFIPSLIAYDEAVKKLGYRTVYIFPDFVRKYDWTEQMRSVADRVYFIPYHQYTWDNAKRIRKICKVENAVLMYSRMTGWDITARLAMPRLPLIWHMELGLDLKSRRQRLKYWIKYRILGFGKTYHIAVSDKTCDVINSLKAKHRCEWIPNAINTDRLDVREEIPFEKPVKLLTFAYLPEIKGFDIALDSCEILNKDKIEYILLASAQQPTYEYIEQRYGRDVPGWLRLIPPTNDISELFDETDILLCPSRSEGLSFANIEGLYSGLPVVYSDIPGNKVLADFKSTYSFESCNHVQLSEKIMECVKNRISAKEQRFNRKIVEEKYTMPVWTERICNYIHKLLSETKNKDSK